MMSKGQTLQDPYLNMLRKEHVPVSIYLVNGIKLTGIIESFDRVVLILKDTVSLMVYKNAISTVVSSRAVPKVFRLPEHELYELQDYGLDPSNAQEEQVVKQF